MTFFRVLQLATVGFGCVCMAMSFGLFVHFFRSRKPIGKAVAFMLLGESVGAMVTVVFSIAADGLINIVGPVSALLMRWIMFSVAFVTSVHLAVQTYRIEVRGDDQ